MNPVFTFLFLLTVISFVAIYFLKFGSSTSSLAQKRLKAFEELDTGSRHKKTSLFPEAKPAVDGTWPGDALGVKKKADRTSTSLLLGGGSPQQQLVLLGIVIGAAAVVLLLVNRGTLPRNVQNILPLGVLAVLVPRMFSIMRVKRLRSKFSEQFPAAIRMMMNSLRAGHDIRSSFEMVSEDMPSPVREEFAHILRELNVGINLETTLKNLQRRMELSDVNIFVVSVLLNNKLGGNLTEILQKLEYTMRDRIKLRREIKSLTAQGQASAMLLTMLVPSVSGYMFITSPDYMRPLWTTSLGLWITIGCYLAVLFGTFILLRMVHVKLE
ncbi:MAG: type II secretion system F family protein [Candidatus Omnitrophica bacterium]|nr:type II secretion system F family protein [Candidatus Omnitrophota bacterium]